MADIGDVLRHLLKWVPGPSEAHQTEMLDAVNEVYPPPAPPVPEPEPDSPEAIQAGLLDDAQKEIVRLKALLPPGS